jgi:hypothetical protein
MPDESKPEDPKPEDSEAARKERAEKLRQQIRQIKEGVAGGPVPKAPESPREKIDRLTHAPKKDESEQD